MGDGAAGVAPMHAAVFGCGGAVEVRQEIEIEFVGLLSVFQREDNRREFFLIVNVNDVLQFGGNEPMRIGVAVVHDVGVIFQRADENHVGCGLSSPRGHGEERVADDRVLGERGKAKKK